LRVAGTHVAPPPREQPERPEPDQLADEQEGEGGEQDRGVARRDREIESQREGRDVGRGRDGHVAEHDEERSVTKKNGEDAERWAGRVHVVSSPVLGQPRIVATVRAIRRRSKPKLRRRKIGRASCRERVYSPG